MLAGKHLLGWAVERGIQSNVFDAVYLMTDSSEYAEIGKRYGAQVPFLEPAEFANDTAHVSQAMKWFLEKLSQNGIQADYVALLEPTAPGRQAGHIQQLIELVVSTGADSGITVAAVNPGVNAHWQIMIDEENRAQLAIEGSMKNIIRHRQALPKLYVRGGSTYVSKVELLIAEEPSLYGDDTRALILDKKYMFDVDTEEDWKHAEKIMLMLQ
jgi:CMP-N-acetylneuraminic acid synthetase